jgi:hypothetical protein
MTVVSKAANQFSVKAYSGDNKTLLAFDFDDATLAKNLAGFTIACKLPGTQPAFYLFNFLEFQNPGKHAQVAGELPRSTANAPIQKYRWADFAHAPENGGSLVAGNYTYTVTPRYFDASGSMLAIDNTKSVSVTIAVGPFVSGAWLHAIPGLRPKFRREYPCTAGQSPLAVLNFSQGRYQ